MDLLSIAGNICGILGFLISLVALGGVIKIQNRINSNNVNVHDTLIGRDFTGRDKTTS